MKSYTTNAPRPRYRALADWELAAEAECYQAMLAAAPDDPPTEALIRAWLADLKLEAERRSRLHYKQSLNPFDLGPVIARIHAEADTAAIFGSRRPGCLARGYGSEAVYHVLCPFHGERTPSLAIYPHDGGWYCFGCGRGGDQIAAVQLLDGLPFVNAVLTLAREFGIPVPSSRLLEASNGL